MTRARRLLQILIAFSICLSFSTAYSGDKGRKRLQELFIWKVSDILELSSEQDSEFRKIIEDLNAKKQAANAKMKASIRALDNEKDTDKKSSLIENYKQDLAQYLNVQQEEMTRLSDLLGTEKMAKYLVVKAKLTQNLKVLMGSGSETKKKPLAGPQVEIEN